MQNLPLLVTFFVLSLTSLRADTVVRIETVLGSFDVQLYDRAGPNCSTPLTVANFLAYTQSGAYTKTFIHRSVPGFVLQGGGFTLNDTFINEIPTLTAVQNEPGNCNVRGTIAMAKLGDDPNSATCQWFINLADNSGNLDFQNEGFTVFGHVLGEGMEIVDALAAVNVYNASTDLGGAFEQLPLLNPFLATENFLMILSVQVVPFAFRETHAANGSVTLRWTGAGDRPVEVHRSTNLVSKIWDVIATGLTSGEFSDPHPPANTPVFYKLVKP